MTRRSSDTTAMAALVCALLLLPAAALALFRTNGK